MFCPIKSMIWPENSSLLWNTLPLEFGVEQVMSNDSMDCDGVYVRAVHQGGWLSEIDCVILGHLCTKFHVAQAGKMLAGYRRARSRWMVVRDWMSYIWSSMLQILCCSGREKCRLGTAIQSKKSAYHHCIACKHLTILPWKVRLSICSKKTSARHNSSLSVTVYVQCYWCIMNTL
jgi:hypothetical protein